MKYDSRLIVKRNAQPAFKRTAWGFVTAIFWLLYIYLWMPLITFLLWAFGIHTALHELYLSEPRFDPFLLVILPCVALLCAILLISWAEYNRFRFRGRSRRTDRTDTPVPEIAHALGADMTTANALHEGKVIVLQMDEHARPTGCLPAR